jgi:hypothetical protein
MKAIILAILFSLFSNFSVAVITEGFTDKVSYLPGETVKFFTSSTDLSGSDQFFIKDINDVNVGTTPITFQFVNQDHSFQTSDKFYINGYNYSQTATWVIPLGLKSGVYYFNTSFKIPIVVKSTNSTPDIVIIYPINTIQGYSNNSIDQKSLYNRKDNGNIIEYSPILSFRRPVLREGQTQISNSEGFLKWMNTMSYSNVNVITDVELDADYSFISGAKLLIVIGHSEYWTRKARLNFDRFVDEGHHAMVLSGNTMCWQARYQTDPNNANNPQLVCYKGTFGSYQVDDNDMIANFPLQETTLWDKPSLKYSVIASIGNDWANGGYGEAQHSSSDTSIVTEHYNGYGGHFISNPQSPLIAGTGLSYGSIIPRLYPTTIDGKLNTGELDGTPISGLDVNGDPILDFKSLGFYRAELIGYDWPEYPIAWNGPKSCSPIMAFQKTCNSGKIINTNCNYWCRPLHFSQTPVQIMTKNMIDLLLGNSDDIWTQQTQPTVFSLKPNMSGSVSYVACGNGFISITSCGVNLVNGYKIDNREGLIALGYDSNCPTYQALRLAQQTNDNGSQILNSATKKQAQNNFIKEADAESLNKYTTPNFSETTSNPSLVIYSNPTKGLCNIAIPEEFSTSTNFNLIIYNSTGEMVRSVEVTKYTSLINVDLQQQAKGIYSVMLSNGNKTIKGKIVIQ